jgi:hypothetical protein
MSVKTERDEGIVKLIYIYYITKPMLYREATNIHFSGKKIVFTVM